MGIFSRILFFGTNITFLLVPWFAMRLNLDVSNITIQLFLDKYANTKIIGASVRIICFVSGAAEVFSCLRILVIKC